ncbi:MAG: Tad domain-containing protein [Tepidisphaeraceae bacterium]
MLVQAMVAMIVLGMFVSLGVDVGVYYTARAELQRAADAACLAGVSQLENNDTAAAIAQATAYAKANTVNGKTLPDQAIRVTLGYSENGVFTENATPANAIRVDLRCTAATGNPVRLYFAQFAGLSSVDTRIVSTSKLNKPSEYLFVGIQRASFGSLGVLATMKGRLVSDGTVSVGMPLGIGVGVQGEARSRSDSVKRGPLAYVTGATDTLEHGLNYPSVSLPVTNDNANISSRLDVLGNFNAIGSVTIPSGTYVVRDLNLVATLSLNLSGPVTFYVTNNCNIAAAVTLIGSNNFSAENFKIRVLPGGRVNFLANLLTPVCLDLYAPDSDIVIAVGVNAYKGRLIGKTLDIVLPTIGTFVEEVGLTAPLPATPALVPST